ncbi:ribbon-helix-helix protein, CopG family [Tolypothrix sp. VBCCA 56010]|uniref:ribbon-helix-helix protein, CopG family n=1 Tax=Tolypothrix sp. VBCCA 56010 TaxID=3137731 RepID=UPI003D7F1634
MKEKHLSVRIPETEMKILEKHAKKTKRTKTDLVREWIRSLEKISDSTAHVQRIHEPALQEGFPP